MKTRARIASGELDGRERGGALLFAGIPYAASTAGEGRFRPPKPAAPWSGVRSATSFGDAAPQRLSGGLTDSPPKSMSESCLVLNVCTPAVDDARRPVLVWIHGGGFQTGQGAIPWYDGSSFAVRGDLVVVSINYRLGALGFANVAGFGGEGFESAGLSGIQDQIAALRWVRENIAAFGGDPDRVTIAGESAGAMSVGTLLACPQAAGLFRGAIAQSGAAHHARSADASAAVAERLAARLGVDSIEGLQRANVEAILDAQVAVAAESAKAGDLSMSWTPTVDGDVLPLPPIEGVRSGSASKVALLVGTNAHETTLFGSGRTDAARLEKLAARIFEDGARALETYRASRPGASVADIAVALTTDRLFRIPAIRLAEAHTASGGTSFQYLFSWESRGFGGALGSTHALEIPFVFNNLERAGVAAFLGEGPRPDSLALQMHDAWIAFVRDGHPEHPEIPAWPAFDRGRRSVMEFGERVGVQEDPGARERDLWDGVL